VNVRYDQSFSVKSSKHACVLQCSIQLASRLTRWLVARRFMQRSCQLFQYILESNVVLCKDAWCFNSYGYGRFRDLSNDSIMCSNLFWDWTACCACTVCSNSIGAQERVATMETLHILIHFGIGLRPVLRHTTLTCIGTWEIGSTGWLWAITEQEIILSLILGREKRIANNSSVVCKTLCRIAVLRKSV
jgi:hypothetical protein